MPVAYNTEDLYINAIFKVIFNIGGQTIEGGFSAVGTPEVSIDMNEYRAGDDTPYRRKVAGLPTVNDITLSKGKIFGAAKIFKQIADNVVYRGAGWLGTVTIIHYHPKGYTKYTLYEAFTTRVRFDGDLDSMASDVSVSEMDIAYRYFDMEEVEDTKAWADALGAPAQ